MMARGEDEDHDMGNRRDFSLWNNKTDAEDTFLRVTTSSGFIKAATKSSRNHHSRSKMQ